MPGGRAALLAAENVGGKFPRVLTNLRRSKTRASTRISPRPRARPDC